MLTTWIESSARGRHGGPIRGGMWGNVVLGTHPIQVDAQVWLELFVDDQPIGRIPAFWLEHKGVNSLWHAPIPPQPVSARLRYRAIVELAGESATSPFQEIMVRPNLPDWTQPTEQMVEGLVGNRRMTVRVDSRGDTYDIYFPTVGLHSNVRPAEGDQSQSRAHFRAIVGGLALGRRLDWFSERLSWDVCQTYAEHTNLLTSEFRWRRGAIRVVETDFAAMPPELPKTMGGVESPGQYLKRFRIFNDSAEDRPAIFGVFIHAEINGGIGEPGLTWQDADRCLLATNRGHGHTNRKLARDSTVEFAIAMDDHGPVDCEPTGPNEAILLRTLILPAHQSVNVDLLVSGGFTGWRGDSGTFDHWLRPALTWFREVDLDQVENATRQAWERFMAPVPRISAPHGPYSLVLERSTLAAALHFDAEWGAVAAGFDRGLNAYCWPRDALMVSGTFERLGHPELGQILFRWLRAVRGQNRAFGYWFHKYSIDGVPEWEAPSIDQTALIPWALERSTRRTGDLTFAEQNWVVVQQAAELCVELTTHPGLQWLDDLKLISSAGLWETRYGAYLYGNVVAVAGLRAAIRLAQLLGKRDGTVDRWQEQADRIWQIGILGVSQDGKPHQPGLVDSVTGRFLAARRLSKRRGIWADESEFLVDRTTALDVAALAMCVPFQLLPPDDPRLQKTAQAMLEHNIFRGDPHALTNWGLAPEDPETALAPNESHRDDLSSLATLWMARYLIELGRVTGDAGTWNQAVAFLDAMIERLSPLGNSLWPGARSVDTPVHASRWLQGVWSLHGVLIETILDFHGLEYDHLDRKLKLSPVLPPRWPAVGLHQSLACGTVWFQLSRPVGGQLHELILETNLENPIEVEVDVTCPELSTLGPWTGPSEPVTPVFDPVSRRIQWKLQLPIGSQSLRWSWGTDDEWFSGV